MTIYLALKKTPTKGVFARIAAWAIKARLVSQYCHGGMVSGGVLFHSTPQRGFHSTQEFEPDKWELYPTNVRAIDLHARAIYRTGAKYDWFSLLAFTGLKARDSQRLYCFEWCFEAMTGREATERVTPETLLSLACKP